ncbi:hypothetical protein SHJG_3016 [Streptomyces hygroscopicus subsp. jinggangensis 5008]|nr:hypothetical protein SHJG_3016 [Streptomyces hygroscopicus subsp. jinggangensis 5008]AGF62447.1 hypothetical protein SHJGH_2781 [Streptomyces hygroscopicus subsp. jinggangensis TL01]
MPLSPCGVLRCIFGGPHGMCAPLIRRLRRGAIPDGCPVTEK